MENMSFVPLKQPIVFQLEGFVVPQDAMNPLFVLSLIMYLVILAVNGIVALEIMLVKNLHKPMYVMVINLIACDLIGGSAVLIRLISDFLHLERTIPYTAAIIQAFCVHFYGAATQTILSAMAYDRYIAICEPLRYHTVMTTGKLVGLCIFSWSSAFFPVLALFVTNVTTPLCGTLIMHVYCSNRSIMRLSCIPTPVNDIYGLILTWLLSSVSFVIIAFTYTKILIACLVNREKASKSKATTTCFTHLSIYVIFEVATLVIVVSQRIDNLSQNVKKFCSLLFVIFPPAINPVIYCLAMKDIRLSIIKRFTFKVSPKQ